MNLKFTFLISLLIFSSSFGQKSGGMWIPTELNEEEMKALGMQINASDIFDPNSPSIKDAIAHFGGGCTSEVISSNGLLLTNHHCGYSQIQSHSSVENDYLKDGFWAKNKEEELINKGLTATFIIDIKDVTEQILQGISSDLTEEQRQTIIKSNIENQSKIVQKESFQDVYIRPFYKGNKYYQFITETYKDIRLVGAPPSSIGSYGMDTDNWMWPRHTGDFSLFRIYADKNNKPAEYSTENVPYTPKHFLPISVKGIKEGDFTFVFGFPGTTDEYLHSSALRQILETVNPARIGIREIALKILDKKMRMDNATRIKYASKYARISNYHKKWSGESLGLKASNAVEKRMNYEKEFSQRIAGNPEWTTHYGQILPELEKLYIANKELEKAEIYFDEAIYRNSETFRVALRLINLLQAKDNGDIGSQKLKDIGYFKGIFKDYDPDLDQEVSLALIDLYKKNVSKNFLPVTPIDITSESFSNSILTGKKLVNGVKFTEDVEKAMSDETLFFDAVEKDPIVQEIFLILNAYENNVSPYYLENKNTINQLQRTYMQAQLETFPEKKLFPDANSTLRVTYGKVDGYQPEGKPRYPYQTFLDGVIAKYLPGDYEYDLPQKLIELEKSKDYGIYGEGKKKKAKMPVNFIATNHTTGGNSGSPALDKDGNLIGLNFDRVWEGTMSDLNYDPSICRNIMVDIRYVLFLIDKFAGAGYLLEEMKVVK